MKKVIFNIILLIILTSVAFSQANWVWQNPLPQNNNLNSVFPLDSSNVIAAGDCGMVIRTSNGGASWSIIQTGDTNNLMSLCFINKNTGWAIGSFDNGGGVIGSSLLSTTNGGLNWTKISWQYPNNKLMSVFFMDSLNGYAGGGSLVYKTSDGGVSWNPLNFSFPDGVRSINFLNANTGFVAAGSYICKTTDAGTSWSSMLLGMSFGADIAFINSQTGYMAGYMAGYYNYRTTNGGTNWNYINFGGSSVTFENQLSGWIASSNIQAGVYRTSDGGNTWVLYNCQGRTLNSVRFTNSSTGWAVGWYGNIQKSTDGGLSWNGQQTGNSPTASYASTMVNTLTGYAFASTSLTTSIYKTINGGLDWSVVSGISTSVYGSSFINENTGWVAGTASSSGKVFVTTDAGTSWNNIFTENVAFRDIKFFNSNTGFVIGTSPIGSGVVFKTTNGGTNWNYFVLGGFSFRMSFSNINTGWVGCNQGYVFRTTNSGTNWEQFYTNSSNDTWGMYFKDQNTGWVGTYGGEIMKTTDGGLNWTVRIVDAYVWDIRFIDDNTGWAAGGEGSLYYTVDGGNNWNLYPRFTNRVITRLSFVNPSTGWLFGDEGMILKTTNGGGIIGIQKTAESIPKHFSLSQNYPNPFNPTTKINFALPKQSFTSIKIYNVLGEEVATLVNENLNPGIYQADWDASNFASSVYFYVLKADDPSTGSGQSFVETKKMVLIK